MVFFLLGSAGGLSDCACGETLSDPVALFGGKGARIALAHLSMEPYLHMAMRLGEGSGAALAMPIVEAACAMFHNMGELAASNIVLSEGNANAT